MYFKTKKYTRRDILFGFRRNFKQQDATAEKTGFGVKAKAIDALMHEGDYQAAKEALHQVLEKHPDHVPARKNFAYCLIKTGHFAEAEKHFQQVLKVKNSDPFSLLYLGLALVKQERIAEAVSWWKGYFNPDQPIINRVLNMQTSLYDMGSLGTREEIEKSIEMAIREQRQSNSL